MNRPFSAFGALITLLALAMLAVSSASRSTTVQATAATAAALPQPHGRGAVYVLVLPAAADDVAADDEVVTEADATQEEADAIENRTATGWPATRVAAVPTYATGCGLDRLTGVVYDCEPCWPSCNEYCALRYCPMLPARVQVARNNAARLGREAEVDCRSHYDPQYDGIVYGIAASTAPSVSSGLPVVRWSEIEGAELLGLFRQLAEPQGTAAPETSVAPGRLRRAAGRFREASIEGGGERPSLTEWDRHFRQVQNLQTMYRGLRNAIATQLALRGWEWEILGTPATSASAPVAWSDYADFIDNRLGYSTGSADEPAALRPHFDASAASAASPAAVRSGRWLLHSAASMLNHAGSWLQEAAEELERAGTHLEARQATGTAR